MKITTILISLILVMLILFCFVGCKPSTNFIVRFDFDSNDIECLYKNMSEYEVFELFGLPHRSTIYIDSSSYDYVSENGILRVEFDSKKLDKATFYGMDHADEVQLPEKKNIEIDGGKYLREIKNNLSIDDLNFIGNDTDSGDIQETLCPSHYYEKYNLDGFNLNAFVYDLKDGNRLYLIYEQNGLVGIAEIQNEEGEIVKSIVALEE